MRKKDLKNLSDPNLLNGSVYISVCVCVCVYIYLFIFYNIYFSPLF